MNGLAVARRVLAILFVWLATGTWAHAQVPDEIDEVQVVQQPAFNLNEMTFNQWVFGGAIPINVNLNGSNLTNEVRDRLMTLLQAQIGEIGRSCSLSEAQKQKLLLAGSGDVKRFLDRVAEARRVFEQFRQDRNNMNTIHQETIPLNATLRAGLFGSDSFFFKTISTTLDPEQAARYQKSIVDRNLFRHQAKVRLAIANLDSTLGFTADQRQKLINLAIEETRPSRKPASQYEIQVIFLKVARLPEAKLRAIFDERQWQALKQQLQQLETMEEFLKTNGFLEPIEPNPTPTNLSK